MADAAEMLWVVLAYVSGGDWTQQSPEWQEAAARWRDNYFAALKAASAPCEAAAALPDPLLESLSVENKDFTRGGTMEIREGQELPQGNSGDVRRAAEHTERQERVARLVSAVESYLSYLHGDEPLADRFRLLKVRVITAACSIVTHGDINHRV